MNKIIDSFGVKYHTLDGKIHREDGPAVIHPDGRKYYYLDDMLYLSIYTWVEALDVDDKTKMMLILKWGGQ